MNITSTERELHVSTPYEFLGVANLVFPRQTGFIQCEHPFNNEPAMVLTELAVPSVRLLVLCSKLLPRNTQRMLRLDSCRVFVEYATISYVPRVFVPYCACWRDVAVSRPLVKGNEDVAYEGGGRQNQANEIKALLAAYKPVPLVLILLKLALTSPWGSQQHAWSRQPSILFSYLQAHCLMRSGQEHAKNCTLEGD